MVRDFTGVDIRKEIGVDVGFNPNPNKKKKSNGISKAILRQIVWKRDKGICQLCKVQIRSNEGWDLARNNAGEDYTEENCFVAHHTCNISQGRKTKEEALTSIGVKKRKRIEPEQEKVKPIWEKIS